MVKNIFTGCWADWKAVLYYPEQGGKEQKYEQKEENVLS